MKERKEKTTLSNSCLLYIRSGTASSSLSCISVITEGISAQREAVPTFIVSELPFCGPFAADIVETN